MSALLVTGIGVFVAGLVAAAFGIPVKEFSFGNTLILSGAVIACTGLIMISLSLVVRELRAIARRLRSETAVDDHNHELRSPTTPVESASDIVASRPVLPGADQTASSAVAHPTPAAPSIPSPPPWQSEIAGRDRSVSRVDLARNAAAPEPPPGSDAAPPPKQRRNLLFSSSLRKDRERAAARLSDPAAESPSSTSPAVPDPDMSPPPSFDDAWPRSERSRIEQGRSSSSSAMPGLERTSEARGQTAPAVTVLKSGVVDGMAYSLYSDGSIEAQMPEGMMRFASIDELRAHLDQRH
jgi:hypothetical protein